VPAALLVPVRADELVEAPAAAHFFSSLFNCFDSVFSRGVKIITHLHLVLRSRMVELYLHSPIYLYGTVLN
jgi:hypothetical protein